MRPNKKRYGIDPDPFVLRLFSTINSWCFHGKDSETSSSLLLGATGCAQVTCISLTPEANMAAVTYGHQLCLRYVDMSDCCRLDDAGLQLVVTYCPAIVQLYVRRCPLVTDLGLSS